MKANISVAIIARNAAHTIAACLDSVVQFVEEVVVCVDALTTDNTAAVAREHGAVVYEGLEVSSYHECPEHGRVLAQHFANARQESFVRCKPETEWLMWLDADDVLAGGERLAEFLTRLSPNIAGVWLDYHYSRTPNGKTSTLFQRERILRRSVGWQWQHRVHEVAAPIGVPTESVEWASTKDIAVYHQHEGHDTSGSAHRNILLLEIDLESNPNDHRALFYLGNQYFALGNWAAAAHYYEAATVAENVYQRWQTWVYLSMAYEKLGRYADALMSAHQAMEAVPYHSEPYYRLAAMSMLQGDCQKTAFWTHLGDSMSEAPFFAFKNPLDKNFNARLTLGQAYVNAGEISKARRELEHAASVVPTPEVLQGVENLRKMESESLDAEAFLRIYSLNGHKPHVDVPESLWKFGRIRDVIVPSMLAARPNTQPHIIFWCGRSVEPWAPPSINTTGIGGSETAVIEIAKRFATDGWRVDIYNEPDKLEGEYDGVGYWGLGRLAPGEDTDVLTSWRNPEAISLGVSRRLSLLWCHDLNRGPDGASVHARWDKVLGVSAWHAAYLSQLYNLKNTSFVPNGINLERFSATVKKVPWRCIYASSPDRGLANLLRMWPDILAAEPQAELHIAYGWDTIDKSIALGLDNRGQLALLKQEVTKLLEKSTQVVWHGRLSQVDLAQLYMTSYCWLYPTSFLEVSCISAMEAMAAGCVPVTSAAGALPETISAAGMIVTGNPYTQAWKEFWVACARAVLLSPATRKPLMDKGRERAAELTWDASYEKHWKPLVAVLLESKKEVSLEATL